MSTSTVQKSATGNPVTELPPEFWSANKTDAYSWPLSCLIFAKVPCCSAVVMYADSLHRFACSVSELVMELHICNPVTLLVSCRRLLGGGGDVCPLPQGKSAGQVIGLQVYAGYFASTDLSTSVRPHSCGTAHATTPDQNCRLPPSLNSPGASGPSGPYDSFQEGFRYSGF